MFPFIFSFHRVSRVQSNSHSSPCLNIQFQKNTQIHSSEEFKLHQQNKYFMRQPEGGKKIGKRKTCLCNVLSCMVIPTTILGASVLFVNAQSSCLPQHLLTCIPLRWIDFSQIFPELPLSAASTQICLLREVFPY